mmetsp:Transcript_34393/g.68323  ORF Transcript_34393/g.68323 Transcript_34393/m.68323 type:complete len:307 (+) Transcript_34393:30-950(+)
MMRRMKSRFSRLLLLCLGVGIEVSALKLFPHLAFERRAVVRRVRDLEASKDMALSRASDEGVEKGHVQRLEARIQYLESRLATTKLLRFPSAAPDVLDDQEDGEWCDVLDEGQSSCEAESAESFGVALRSRSTWLVGLLVVQSLSSFILNDNEALIKNHPSIVFFLTMLVGAGGNAGNQAAVRIIRAIATDSLTPGTQWQFMRREFTMALAISAILTVFGFIRVIVFNTPLQETVAITVSLSIITFISIVTGAALPILFQKGGVDPAHASTSIQVLMDIGGVLIVCAVCSVLMDPVAPVILGAVGL